MSKYVFIIIHTCAHTCMYDYCMTCIYVSMSCHVNATAVYVYVHEYEIQ